MRDDGVSCSEETLSALLDDELDQAEKRQVAIHVAGCCSCARLLGELFAARASVAVPAIEEFALPRAFWRGVRSRLDEVDNLIRATDLLPQRRRPIVAPKLAIAAAMVVVLAVAAKSYVSFSNQTLTIPTRLTQLHMAASVGPSDPGFHQTVGFSPNESWRPVSHSVIAVNGAWVFQTIYTVGGLPVSVFRVPAGALDVSPMSPVPVGNQTLYVAQLRNSSLAARRTQTGWDVVVSRSRPEGTIVLCLACPPDERLPQADQTWPTGY